MLYVLAQYLQEFHSFFNVFHYVSVRAMAAFLTSLIVTFLCGDWFIRLSERHFRSTVRRWTPDRHTKEKNNTPTMGGLFIVMIYLINTFLWNNLAHPDVWIFTGVLVGFAAIGYIDDMRKIKQQRGISASWKFGLQIGVATIAATTWYVLCDPMPVICVPFFKKFLPYIGWGLVPWAVFVIVATSNAVNLTDGLDGLAAGPLLFNFSAYAVIAYLAGHKLFATYLHIPYAMSSELVITSAALIGGLLGFLWYNTHPAQIFMGDVGSLAMGAALGMTAIMTRQELLLICAGGIFVAETLSVMLQVVLFKLTGKRLFKMAPIHHHFELMGWSETKITIRFWIIAIVLSVLSLLFLKIR